MVHGSSFRDTNGIGGLREQDYVYEKSCASANPLRNLHGYRFGSGL